MQIPSGKNQGGDRKNQIDKLKKKKIPKGRETLFGIIIFTQNYLKKILVIY